MRLFKYLKEIRQHRPFRLLTILTLSIISFGTIIYHFVEGWSWIDSMYFSVITLTTVGYGDFSPATNFGKIFTIFYILTGIGIILGFVNTFYQHRISSIEKARERRHKKKNS